METTTKPRGRARTTRLSLNDTEVAQVLEQFTAGNSGGAVALAKAFNVQPNYISQLLKNHGLTLQRGRKPGTTTAVVPVITAEMSAELVQAYNSGSMKLAALSAKTGIPASVLSLHLKSVGVEVKRGKPSKVAVTA